MLMALMLVEFDLAWFVCLLTWLNERAKAEILPPESVIFDGLWLESGLSDLIILANLKCAGRIYK